jgi:hypothetical protein
MGSEKRKGDKPIPDRLEEVLNEMQILSLHRMENFGWQLRFVRRPLFQESIPVIFSGEGERYGILEAGGRINMEPDITIRGKVLNSPSQI